MSKTDSRIPVVGIGASAGGVQALLRLFEALPSETGAAFVVILHMDPGAPSHLAEILSSRSEMRVHQVTRAETLEANCVYVIPPDRSLRITGHAIAPVPFDAPRGRRAPIDLLFRSLAEQHQDGFAVILTGSGSDGALGARAIKESGGLVFVQSPEEAEYASMPRAAIASEAADFVLPIAQLAIRLSQLIGERRETSGEAARAIRDEQLRAILSHVRARTGHDFLHYKRSTVTRRILRRMHVAGAESFNAYAAYMHERPEEAQALLSELLISVTTFFRDQDSFDALNRLAIAKIFTGKDGSDIRVWIAGCATGEEAYSIGILLLEEASRHAIRPDIQIFATDLDSRALAIGREGRYPAAIETDLREDRLHRFFNREGEFYRVKRELRDIVLFSSHSVLKDPPFPASI